MANNEERRSLKVLLIVNAVFTFLGGVGLMFFPEKITYGIIPNHQYNFIFYLLGVCAISLAYLSFAAAKLTDNAGLKIVVITFLIFHGATMLVGIITILKGVSIFVLVNAVVHFLFFMAFFAAGRKFFIHQATHK